MGFNMNMKLFKIDEMQGLIYGRATQEIEDKAGEVMDYASSKPNFEKWSNDFATRTNGKSYGNVRIQHDSSRVGGKIAEPLVFNDADKAIDVCIKVTDNEVFELVKSGVYTGLSIGGSYGKQWIDDSGVLHYTAIPCELSIVDNPAVPTASIMYVKADGTTEMKTFTKKEDKEMDNEKATAAEQVTEETKATVEKTAEAESPKQEESPVKKADEPKAEEKPAENKVEKSAEVEKDVFEMCSKAMDNADDSVKEKCNKLFHKMVEKGLWCKCDKCAKAVDEAKAEKAASDTDLHKAEEPKAEPMQKFAPADELAKAMDVIDELKKGFKTLKSDNEALKKQVEKLENEPVAGGAMVATGTMALDKTIGGTVGNPTAEANSEADVLRKMIDEADSAVLKEAYSKKLATLEMKKIFG